jgi:NAD(P)-dependent dehydrogenase (short-subunit alcohol dehydrogenase family)
MGKLDDKVALVTGGNRGIGKAIAAGLAKEGAKVAIAARDQKLLKTAALELSRDGNQVLGVPADVSDEEQVKALYAQILECFGTLDILINNAGAFDGGPVEEVSLEEWNRVIGACLTGPFLCTREAFRIMKPNGGGRIINIGSISAQRTRDQSSPYTSAKHGVWGLTQATALEGRAHGIVVSALHPGNTMVERRMNSDKTSDSEPMMTAQELAEVAVQMASMPPHINFLEAIVLPTTQDYIGRG